MTRSFLVLVTFDNGNGEHAALPVEAQVATALAFTTASDALGDATDCDVRLEVVSAADAKEMIDRGMIA